MIKFKMIDEKDFSTRHYASDDLKNLGKKGKPYLAMDWGVTLPFCPFCNEPAYELTHCVFCGADFEEQTDEDIEYMRSVNNEISVRYNNIIVQQCCDSAYVFKDNNLICHMSLAHPLNKEELLEIAKKYAK